MKSAYEIAMERLEAESGPTKKLSDAQKSKIADIEKTFDAKVAELNLTYDSEAGGASPAEAPGIREELSRELVRIQEQREKAKEAVWNQSAD